jgi:large subunit ribosomal protein L22
MEIVATMRFARMAPSKGRALARKLRGLPVADALKIVDFSISKAGFLIGKTLKSAIANAENKAKLSVDNLTVKKAVVDEGPRLKRFWPRARGSASPILKRMCHIRIVLTDGAKG